MSNIWKAILALLAEAPTEIETIETAFNLHPSGDVSKAVTALQVASQVAGRVVGAVQNLPS